MGLFNNRLKNNMDKTQVPVWFMRQAGRYHAHYQNIKKDSDFMSMCKSPQLACDITMGPIDEFNFDAAILFSDLLFPLEQLNMGLSYEQGPPTLKIKCDTLASMKKLKVLSEASTFYRFQAQALTLLKEKLSSNKTLLGFVGGPWTLYTYAVEGSHAGNLTDSKKGLYDGRFSAFMELLLPQLMANMNIQAAGGADALCLFDTAVGELTHYDFVHLYLPVLKSVTSAFKKAYPHKKIIYYSKLTHLHYLQAIEDDHIDVLGVDWRNDLCATLKELGNDYYIQGNFDPSHLHLPWPILQEKLDIFWRQLNHQNLPLKKWICGLGHGVLQKTPEKNVKETIKYIHENFVY